MNVRSSTPFVNCVCPMVRSTFCSNDYLGIATQRLIGSEMTDTGGSAPLRHGSSGSRLLAGNYPLIEETERTIAAFHEAATGLIFNSG